jgi:hypothetical protein
MKGHFLPICYLKGFLDVASTKGGQEPYLWVRDRDAKRLWRKRAPHKVARRPDYYAVTRSDGRKDYTREDALAQLESNVAPV